MKRWLRFTAAVLAAAFLFALTGCGSSTNSASFTWFVDSIPANLDPQVASGASDVIACENLYGTLVRKDPDGELVPGLCEKWTVSSDGLTYTFTLKDGLTYAAAKGALKMLTKNIASEYGEYNIRGFCICVPAHFPCRDRLALCGGVFRHSEQRRRAGGTCRRKQSGRFGQWAADVGVPAERAGR